VSQPFVGQLMLVGFNFAPVGWVQCAGQLLPISQYTAVFSLLGTFYGGNGTNNFGLPNLQGLIPVGMGQGPGLSNYSIGQQGGSQTVSLLTSEMPQHTHTFQADGAPGSENAPANGALARLNGGTVYGPGNSSLGQQMKAPSVTGGSLPHNNMMPYLTLNWIIALQGVFPARN